MESCKQASLWKKKIDPVLVSKVDELKLLGYNRATKDEVWKTLTQKVWKGDPELRLYEIVQDILHMSSHTYVSYLTKEAYQDEDLLASIEALSSEKK